MKSVRLRYVKDDKPGIKRERAGRGFRYKDVDGKPLRDKETLGRIKALAIPPAWTDVWICPFENGHLQSTGRDSKRRKQYRYHPKWREQRDETKFDRILEFGRALPKIRLRLEEDLALPGLPREKVLATIVQLLEMTLIRIGNEEYARANRSFGLTTMRDQHVKIDGAQVRFQFRGKSGLSHSIDFKDRRLARIIERCQDLPGQELFQYLDEDDTPQTIDSSDVNTYLREISGEEFTAKDFRTWAGTVQGALELHKFKAFDSETEAKRNIVRAIETVAVKLGNTPAVCRKSYIHPAILELYISGTLVDTLEEKIQQELAEEVPHLQPEEAAVLALLEQRLKRDAENKT